MTGLFDYRYHYAGSLHMAWRLEINSHGGNTEALLFDEPAAGMNENET